VPRRRVGPPHLLGNRRAGVDSRVLKKQPAAWECRGPSSQVENEGLCSSTNETSDRGGRLHESRPPPAAGKGKDAPASLSLPVRERATGAGRLATALLQPAHDEVSVVAAGFGGGALQAGG